MKYLTMYLTGYAVLLATLGSLCFAPAHTLLRVLGHSSLAAMLGSKADVLPAALKCIRRVAACRKSRSTGT